MCQVDFGLFRPSRISASLFQCHGLSSRKFFGGLPRISVPSRTGASLAQLLRDSSLAERALERVQILYVELLDSAPERVDVDGSLVQGLTQLIGRSSARGKER